MKELHTETINEFFHRLCELKGAHIFDKVDFGEVVNVYEKMMRDATTPNPKVFQSGIYNMTTQDGINAYLIDLTDFLLKNNNATITKVSELEKKLTPPKTKKVPCNKPQATEDCLSWCMVNHVCKYETRWGIL